MGNRAFRIERYARRSDPAQVPAPPPMMTPPLSPPASPPPTHTLPDGITIIWLDPHATSINDAKSLQTQQMLKRIHSSVVFYDTVEQCLSFFDRIDNDQAHIFLVVSGTLSLEILQHLSQCKNLDSIFIFCLQPDRYEDLLKKYAPYVIGIFSEEYQLKTCIEMELNEYSIRAQTMNFFAQNQNTTRDLTYDAASFLWFQIIQKLLRETHYTDKQKNEMLDYCRQHYSRNNKRDKFLKQINEFQSTYHASQACQWYTRQSFVYKLINSALRTEDINALYMFRFYISDLCRQLVQESQIYRQRLIEHGINQLIVYRGCRMRREELEKLRDIAKKRSEQTSMNGFISTSLKREVAAQFQDSHSHNRSNVERVFWTIDIDVKLDEVIYADVSAYSVHPEEKEVLLNIGTTFYIDQITLDENTGIWQVKAEVNNGGSSVVNEYLALVRRELEETNIQIVLGILLIDMGKYSIARNYLLDQIEQTPEDNWIDFAALHYYLGLTYSFERELDPAETNFLQAIEYLRHLPDKRRNMVRVYNALGQVYQINGELQEAIDSYQRAESTCISHLQIDDIANAQTYTYMGQYYCTKEMYQQAMDHYERALAILLQHLPENHHRIGILSCEMGNVRRREQQNDLALKLYQKAEKILLLRLPKYHPCTAYCWSNMGILYLQMGDLKQARHYHGEALKTYKRVLPSDHPNIRISEKNLQCTQFSHILDTYLQVCSQV